MRFPFSRSARAAGVAAGIALLGLCVPSARAQVVTQYRGDAVGAEISVFIFSANIAPVGPLPTTGGFLTNSAASASVSDFTTTLTISGTLFSTATIGVSGAAQSGAVVSGLSAVFGTTTLFTADTVRIVTLANAFGTIVSSTFTNLIVEGNAITVTGTPGQTVSVLGGAGTLFINEQTAVATATSQDITANALRLEVPGFSGPFPLEAVVAGASSGVTFDVAPAADVPEPGTLALLMGGILPVGAILRRRRAA